jgi:hypothetical protein
LLVDSDIRSERGRVTGLVADKCRREDRIENEGADRKGNLTRYQDSKERTTCHWDAERGKALIMPTRYHGRHFF